MGPGQSRTQLAFSKHKIYLRIKIATIFVFCFSSTREMTFSRELPFCFPTYHRPPRRPDKLGEANKWLTESGEDSHTPIKFLFCEQNKLPSHQDTKWLNKAAREEFSKRNGRWQNDGWIQHSHVTFKGCRYSLQSSMGLRNINFIKIKWRCGMRRKGRDKKEREKKTFVSNVYLLLGLPLSGWLHLLRNYDNPEFEGGKRRQSTRTQKYIKCAI